MKNVILIAIAGLAVGGLSTTVMAHEPTYYSSRKDLISTATTVASASPRLQAAQEHSTRNSLLLVQRTAPTTKVQAVNVVFYNSKSSGSVNPSLRTI
jgi:hypothetical protein